MKKSTHSLEYIKRQAKKLKKEHNISHTAALNLIAVHYGYSNWQHCYRSLNSQQHSILKNKPLAEEFEISFTDWLKKHKNRNSPLGDLATDMLSDRDWPLYNSLEDYRGYLIFRRAANEAIETLERAWKTYVAYIKRKMSPGVSKRSAIKKLNVRKITFIKNISPLHFTKRIVEKFNPGDKAWISWDGRNAIPVMITEVDDRHYTFKIESPLKDTGSQHSLYLDEVCSTPELACINRVTG